MTFKIRFDPETAKGQRLEFDLISPIDGEVIAKKGRKISKVLSKKIESVGIEYLQISREELTGRYLAQTILKPGTR